MIKRDNHYVPQMYLKRWATGKKLWVYTLLVPHENFPTWDFRALKGLAYLKNLYVRVDGSEESDDFEIDFDSRFENPASLPLEKLCSGEKLASDEWRIVSDYITSQYVRTPAFYIAAKSIMIPTVEKTISDISNKLATTKTIPLIEHELDPASNLLPHKLSLTNQLIGETHTLMKLETVIGKSYWLFAINWSLRPHSRMMNAMRAMKWSIVTAPENYCWPTSDNPVAVVHIKPNGQMVRSSRLQSRNTMVIFPISPQKLLIGKPRNRLAYTFKANMSFYHQIRRVILNNAFLQVYSVEIDSEVVDIRPRTIDCASFNRVHKEFDTWYANYKSSEVPMLQPNNSFFSDNSKERDYP